MAKRGPKTKYTPDRVEKILGFLRGGNTRGTAAMASGIDMATLTRWQAKYADFAQQVKEAEQEAVAMHVKNIELAAAKGAWQASAWYLERRHHTEWGKKDRLEVVQSVRDLARSSSVDEDTAVRQAEEIIRELRSRSRA